MGMSRHNIKERFWLRTAQGDAEWFAGKKCDAMDMLDFGGSGWVRRITLGIRECEAKGDIFVGGGMMGKEDMEWLEKNVGVGRIVRETKTKCPKCGQQLLGLLMITRHVCAK